MTLFNNDDQVIIDENKNYLEELVGEGKKFKSPEDLARGKYEADMFIQAKNRQYDALFEDYSKLREQVNAGATLQELVDQLKQQQEPIRDEHPDSKDKPPVLNKDELEEFVSSLYKKNKEVEKEEQNLSQVTSKLKERFGNNFTTYLKEKAESLGLSEAETEALAKRNPRLFYKTFDVEISGDGFSAPPKNQQLSGFQPRVVKRTMSYYNKLRREKPDEFFKRETSIQMDKDAQALGAEFFDT